MKIPRSKTPLFVQQLQWFLSPVAYLSGRVKKHGPIFFAMSDRMPVVFVSEPSALKKVFTNEKKDFTVSGEANKVLLPLIGPESILMISGDVHRQRRQLLMPAFHQESMRSFSEIIQRVAMENFTSMQMDKPCSMRTLFQKVSLQVIEEVVFGIGRQSTADGLRTEIANLAELVSSPLIALTLFLPFLQTTAGGIGPYSRLKRQIAKTDELIFQAISSRRDQQCDTYRDMLALLMAARDEDGEALTDSELRDELTTMLLAGHETTATAMSWAIYQICSHPDAKEKLFAELDSLPQNPDAMQIFKLPYLSAVCNETLRINPVVINTAPRVTQGPVELNGFQLDGGTHVVGCIYLLHQREDIYPQPDLFRPERFLERNFGPFEFMPFGGGARRCLGEMLANFEMRLVLANLLLNFDVHLVKSGPEQPRRRVVTLAPAGGVRVTLTRRS